MELLWFWLVAVMFAIYVVMDGFDFGAGILHLAVAKTNEERREVLGAIGPFWDGNEVWLLAGGGSLFLAFPKVLASGFSGFYLAMWVVVWCLMLRGISIEFRSHVQDGLWRHFWDGTFAVASVLLPVLFGTALGNVLRGVPLDASGYFSVPLWTTFGLGPQPGVLDWYTVLIGVFTLATVAAHGGRQNAFTSSDYPAYYEEWSADNVELSARLVTAQIRRLEAEKLLLEARIEALKRDTSAAAGVIETSAPKPGATPKSTTKPVAAESGHGGGHP